MVDTSKLTTVKVVAVADLHYTPEAEASVVPELYEAASLGDILVVCGDLTHHGLVEEATALARAADRISIPILAVLGNHDFHSGQKRRSRPRSAALASRPSTVMWPWSRASVLPE